jgi:hypothetical protein
VSQAVKSDVATRVARERADLAVARRDGALALEACDMHLDLYSQGYTMWPLAVDTPGSKPFAAKYSGTCAACQGPVAVGEPVVFRADRSVAHSKCTWAP